MQSAAADFGRVKGLCCKSDLKERSNSKSCLRNLENVATKR